MHSTMKKVFLFFSLFIVVSLACDLSVTTAPPASPVPTNTTIPTTDPATPTPEIFISLTQAMPSTFVPAAQSVEVSVDPLTIFLQPELASGARGIQVPRAEGQDLPYWGLTPGHTQLKLEGYLLQGKFHEPQIYVYPAQAYAEMIPGAFESIRRLNNILYGSDAPITADQLPAVPFFNATQVFASNIQVISFQNGGGVRFLTEYAQYTAPANNHELFYQFQGVTREGAYYIVAIFPITAPVLAETSEAGATLPAGGIAYPGLDNTIADWDGYYASVADLLNATASEAFTPTINQLDLLIQSMRVTP